jgi:hypothetical protein
MSLLEFADGNIEIAGQAALIGSLLQSFGGQSVLPVSGVGLVAHEGQIRPMIALDYFSDETTHIIRPMSEITEFSDIFRPILGPDLVSRIYVLFVAPPEPFIAPGDNISSPNPGRVGCAAYWHSGSGFLTAGHVATTAGAGVFDGRTRLGTIKYVSNPAGGGTVPMADVAVVELSGGSKLSASFGARVAAPANSTVTVQNGRVGASGKVFAFCSFTYWSKVSGTYGDTYITDRAVSVGGDSGSAVTDISGNLVGMLVGGTTSNSYIQDVQYQIGRVSSSTSAGLSGLRL